MHKQMFWLSQIKRGIAALRINRKSDMEIQVETTKEKTQDAALTKDPICLRSNSIRSISNAKVKTVKLTVVVVLGYMLCSAPFVCVQLYTVLGNPSPAVSKYSSVLPFKKYRHCIFDQ